MRGGSKRGVIPAGEQHLQWLFELGLFAKQTHFQALSGPFPLTGFQMGLPAGCGSRGMAAKTWTSSHLLKAGRMFLSSAITLWLVKEKLSIFHFWTLGVRATRSQCKVKPLNYCSFSIVSFLWKNSSAPFHKLLANPGFDLHGHFHLHRSKDEDVRQQGHLQAAGRSICNTDLCCALSLATHFTLWYPGPGRPL